MTWQLRAEIALIPQVTLEAWTVMMVYTSGESSNLNLPLTGSFWLSRHTPRVLFSGKCN